ncbi:MAG: DUF4190 domain-containing protein [Bacteroidota bacterium]
MKPGLNLSLLSVVLAITLLLSSCSSNLFTGAKFGYRHKVKAGKQLQTTVAKQHQTVSIIQNQEPAVLIDENPTAGILTDNTIAISLAPPKVQASVLAETTTHTSETIIHNPTKVPNVPPEKDNSFEGFATAGFVFSLIGLFFLATYLGWMIGILGMLFCVIALSRIAKNGKKGVGLAVAGIIIFITMVTLIIILLRVAMSSGG